MKNRKLYISLASVGALSLMGGVSALSMVSCTSNSCTEIHSNNKEAFKISNGILENMNPKYKHATKIYLPTTITEISMGAFEGFENLEEIFLPEKLTTIGNNAFKGCGSLARVIIPESVNSIGDNAFQNCASLGEVTIKSNSFNSIGKDIFGDTKNDMNKLGKITFSNQDLMQKFIDSNSGWKKTGPNILTR